MPGLCHQDPPPWSVIFSSWWQTYSSEKPLWSAMIFVSQWYYSAIILDQPQVSKIPSYLSHFLHRMMAEDPPHLPYLLCRLMYQYPLLTFHIFYVGLWLFSINANPEAGTPLTYIGKPIGNTLIVGSTWSSLCYLNLLHTRPSHMP